MKKLALHVLAGAAFVAAPLHADATPSSKADLLKQNLTYKISAVEFLKAGEYGKACDALIQSADFKEKHRLQMFDPLAGDQERRSLISKGNMITAESNGLVNKNGSRICGLAGKVWKTRNWPTVVPASYRVESQIADDDSIKQNCIAKWGTNYRMVKYCYDKQTEAKRALGL